jgi:hypothetical protein
MVLQVFATRYRSGEIAPGGNVTRSRTVEAALRAIGQTMANVGAQDPRYTTQGQFHYRIQQKIKGYTHQDPPAVRVKPIPFTIITHALTNAHSTLDQAIADMAVAGFFFLLRPGKHTVSAQHCLPGSCNHLPSTSPPSPPRHRHHPSVYRLPTGPPNGFVFSPSNVPAMDGCCSTSTNPGV